MVGTCRVVAEQNVTRGGIKVNTNTHRRRNETVCLFRSRSVSLSIRYAYFFTPNSSVTSCRNYGAVSDLTYRHMRAHGELNSTTHGGAETGSAGARPCCVQEVVGTVCTATRGSACNVRDTCSKSRQ